ncbi:PaaI family thioesterase [Ochrobactrum sp. S46]|nr:PaaI family thioesterase [Ochrobactrum sp. S45]MBK0046505.1 PaaI family thioesterase [Ochrobactrum sp. S46]
MDLPTSYSFPWALDTILRENGLLHAFGVCFDSLDEGGAAISLRVTEQHRNTEGRIHGGTIATLLDAVCGFAIRFDGTDRSLIPAVTVSLSVNFQAAAGDDNLFARGWVTSCGRQIFFAQGEIRDGNGLLVASAIGAFKRHETLPIS